VSWLVDTDVLSQLAKRQRNEQVVAWIKEQRAELYTSSIVVAQLSYWIRTKTGAQKQQLQRWLSGVLDSMPGRILSFNASTAVCWAELRLNLGRKAQPMPVEDSYIAATAMRYGLTIATGNDRHFRRSGLKVFNPFEI
jgi:predicted nucleic acid-binding protein